MKEVNKSCPKIDGTGLIHGKAAYTMDFTPLNALVVKVLRSPYAFAKIRKIDTSKAEKLDGVECILTYKNVPRNVLTRAGQGYPEPSPYDKFIFDEYVRYIGDEVAAVAAENQSIAIEALNLIEVDYEVLDPVLDFECAEGNKSIIHPEIEAHEMFPTGFKPFENIASEYNMEYGNADETFKKCSHIVSERYYTQAQEHVPMEAHCCFAYVDYQDRLTIVSSTQTPFHVRRIISSAIDYPIEKIRVIKPRIGGGYGCKQAIHGELIVSLMALRTGKPAKLTYTRKEVFESTYTRHQMRIDVKMGADDDGNIKAIDMEVLSNTGAYGEHALTVFMGVGSKTLSMYNKTDAVKFGGKVVYTNHTPAGAFRGYGAIQGNFAIESTVDKLADEIGLDPVEFRLKNMIKEGETSPVFKIMGEGSEGVDMVMDSCKLDYCLKRAAELSGYKDKAKGNMNKNIASGIGCAIALQGSGISKIDMASAIIKLNDKGFFNLLIGATDIGTGSDTILAQIAAEAIGVPASKIIVYSSDTDLTPFDTGAYASSTTYVSGNAVKIAGENMRCEIISAASEILGAAKDDILFDGSLIKTKDGSKPITLDELSTKLYYSSNQKQLVTSGSFSGKVSPPPFAAGFAEVEVDTETGKVELKNYTAVVDCGTAVNPNLARIQVEGGLVQGIGMTLFEDIKYGDDGRLLNSSFLTYRIPSRKDINNLTVEIADSFEPTGPFGAKSVGEIGIDTPPAAITNAIYNAVGVRITKLPVKPEDILRALKNKDNK